MFYLKLSKAPSFLPKPSVIAHHVFLEKTVKKNPLNSYFFFTNSVLQVRMLNDQMHRFERAFVDPQGLPGRPFVR